MKVLCCKCRAPGYLFKHKVGGWLCPDCTRAAAVSPDEERILHVLSENPGGASARKIALKINKGRALTAKCLQRLKQIGKITEGKDTWMIL